MSVYELGEMRLKEMRRNVRNVMVSILNIMKQVNVIMEGANKRINYGISKTAIYTN